MRCTYPMHQFDGLTVFDTKPYVVGVTTQVNVVQIIIPVTRVWYEYVYIQRTRASTITTRLVLQTRNCEYSRWPLQITCFLNSRRTRRLSAAYRDPIVIQSYPDLSDLSDAAYITMGADIVQSVEDVLDSSNDTQKTSCLNKIPINLATCSFTTSNTVSSLTINDDCGDNIIAPICQREAVRACTGLSKDYRCSSYVSYDACIVAQIACSVFFPCLIKGIPDCTSDCLTSSDFSVCMSDYDSVDRCKAVTGIKCYSYGYQQVASTACTSTSVSGGCPYTPQNEALMKASGLPAAGFCPACIATTWASCSPIKSSQTYALAQAANTFHPFQSQDIRNNVDLPTYASHFSMQLGTLESGAAVQCGRAVCSANERTVQLYKNMYSCIDCFTVPNKFCSGNHQCRFHPSSLHEFDTMAGYADHRQAFEQGNTTYSKVFDAVRWAVEALRLRSFPAPVGVVPQWMPFLDSLNFTYYNPSALKQIFNANVESLGAKCVTDVAMPDLSKCQNDLPRTTLRSFVQSQYKVQQGVVVPSKTNMSWFVGNSQMLSTNLVAWSVLPERPFFDTLFNDSICEQATMDSLVCMKNGSSMLALNPIMSGRFEVRQGCDILDSVVDGLCNQFECPRTDPLSDIYNTFAPNAVTRCGILNSQVKPFLLKSDV